MALEFPSVTELSEVPLKIVAEGKGYGGGPGEAAAYLRSLPQQHFGGPANTSLDVIGAGARHGQPKLTAHVARKPSGHDFN